MPSSINDYRSLIEKPYGRIFYDIVFSQLEINSDKKLDILDYGAGFCVTANQYAKHHNVTAYEPNPDMLMHRVITNKYSVIDSHSEIKELPDECFDYIICHNVLEYVPSKEEIIPELARLLKPNGILSIVKHNKAGRIIATAVFSDSPKEALELIKNEASIDSMFGKRDSFSNETLIQLMKIQGLDHQKTFGVRAFYGLSSNNDIKYTDEWYENMLELEIKVAEMEEYRQIAFFNHLKFIKK